MPTDDDLEYVVKMLADMNLAVVAERVGLNYQTVWKIATGRTTAPAYSTVRKLAEYLRGKANG